MILFECFPDMTEACFIEWIDAVAESSQRFSFGHATTIASALKQREWESAAFHLKDLAGRPGRDDFRQAWEGYWTSLGKFERFVLRLTGPTAISSTFRKGRAYHSEIMDAEKTTALFVTALGSEFKAVRAYLSDVKEKQTKGTIYAAGRLALSNLSCEVIVVQTGMGNSKAAVETERAIERFSPRYAFFVGIAGGLKDDLKVGDVVAADKVHGYEYGKAASEFRPRPEATWISHEAVQRAHAVARDNEWVKRILPAPALAPSAFVKPVAAGEKVIDSHRSEAYKLIKQSYGDAYAVAMEDLGFAYAAHANRGVTFAVVRGISDFAANKVMAEERNSQEIAASHAAAFAIEMLAGFFTQESFSLPPKFEPIDL
jgi:nucleoside phosphorylase